MKLEKKIQWSVTAVLGATAFVLAFIGFDTYFLANGIDRNFIDLIFHSIKIFGMELVDEYASPLPLTLEIARWLAPGVLFYTAIRGVIYLIHREFSMMKIKTYKKHIIISGINSHSIFLINDLLKNNQKVIVISDSHDEADKEAIKLNGGVVIPGKLSGNNILSKIAASEAKYFILLNDDDENISDSIAILNYLKNSNSKSKAIIHTHVSNFLTLNELKEIDFFKNILDGNESDFNNEVRIFSKNERASRLLINRFAPDFFRPIISREDKPLNTAILGSGDLAQSMIVNIASLGHYINNAKVRISLFHDNHKLVENIKRYSPGINELVELNAYYGALDILDVDKFIELQNSSAFDVIYILCDDDRLSLKLLNDLCKMKFDSKIDVVLALVNPDGILNKWYKAEKIGDIHLHKLNITAETFTAEAIVSERIDELAKIIHNDYFDKIKKEGKINSSKDSHREWDYLNEDFKNQNRMQAEHINFKVRSIGCKVVPFDDKRVEFEFTNDAKLVELLSEMEHNRWAAHLILNGWKCGIIRDDKNKIHTDLIPYDDLSDEVKQYDRDTIINIPVLLKKLSLKIVKAE